VSCQPRSLTGYKKCPRNHCQGRPRGFLTGKYTMMAIVIITAPDTAPPVLPPVSPPKTGTRLDMIDQRIVTAVAEHGVVKLWPRLNEIAKEEGVTGRQRVRAAAMYLYRRVRRLIKAGILVGAGRNCIAVPGAWCPVPYRHRPRRTTVVARKLQRAGSGATASPASQLSISAQAVGNQLFRQNSVSSELPDAPMKTETVPTKGQISAAARHLASLPRKRRKRWTGWLHGRHTHWGQLVELPDGRLAPLTWANRGRVLVLNPDSEPDNESFPWVALWERDVKLHRNPAAVALGKLKRGVAERPSEIKAASARKNGSMPCRPGKRRGRPRKYEK